jgi:hypothetical protein
MNVPFMLRILWEHFHTKPASNGRSLNFEYFLSSSALGESNSATYKKGGASSEIWMVEGRAYLSKKGCGGSMCPDEEADGVGGPEEQND